MLLAAVKHLRDGTRQDTIRIVVCLWCLSETPTKFTKCAHKFQPAAKIGRKSLPKNGVMQYLVDSFHNLITDSVDVPKNGRWFGGQM